MSDIALETRGLAKRANRTRNAADALRSHRVRVNAVNRGGMDTPGEDERPRKHHGATGGWLAGAEAKRPPGMLVKPVPVAGLDGTCLAKALAS